MSLDLTPRQRAMLDEMGVHVWWPESSTLSDADALALQAESDRQCAAELVAIGGHPISTTGGFEENLSLKPSAVTALVSPAAQVQAVVAMGAQPPAASHLTPPSYAPAAPGPRTLLPLAGGTSSMDWPGLRAAVMACQACNMCLGRRAPVLAAPAHDLRADWLVLGEPPDDVQERAGMPFVDDAGKLLDNMLKAVGVCRDPSGANHAAPAVPAHSTAYLSLVLKCRPAVPSNPDAAALAACANYLQREIALVQPKVILAMGRLAMQVLLSQDHPHGLKLPLGKLRGQVWHYQGVPVVVTYPPAYLLRSGQDKARAWEDLCLALDVVRSKTGSS
jgi:uracil-DNA glycosylase family 4